MADYNPNFGGGDIMTGAKDIRQLTFGPRHLVALQGRRPRNVYLLSRDPPKPGALGMCGADAADVGLKEP